MRSIITIILPLSPVIQQWQQKKSALQSDRKTMHSFLDAGSNPDSVFILYASYFHIMLKPNVAFTFLIVIRCENYLTVFHVTFFTSIYEITYVPHGFRTDDAG